MTPLDKIQRDWLEHGQTALLRKHVAEQQEIAFRHLLAVCRESDDPKVTRRAEAYEQIGSFLAQLGKERADARDDGDD